MQQENIKLFGSKIAPACEYCKYSQKVTANTDLYCDFFAYDVTPFNSCKHFDYDPLKRVPKRRMNMPVYDENDFKL